MKERIQKFLVKAGFALKKSGDTFKRKTNTSKWKDRFYRKKADLEIDKIKVDNQAVSKEIHIKLY